MDGLKADPLDHMITAIAYMYINTSYSLLFLEEFLSQSLWQQVVQTPICEEDIICGGELALGLVGVVLRPKFVQWDNLRSKQTEHVYVNLWALHYI